MIADVHTVYCKKTTQTFLYMSLAITFSARAALCIIALAGIPCIFHGIHENKYILLELCLYVSGHNKRHLVLRRSTNEVTTTSDEQHTADSSV